MNEIYLTSDLHFSHKNMSGEGLNYCDRPWDTIDEMNEGLIENWNATVGADDLVYVLGDVALGKIDESLALLPRLNGFKRLIAGNHDRCWEGNGPKHKDWIKRYDAVGFRVTGERKIIHNGYFFYMDHFPYRGDSEFEDRYPEYRPVDTGSWLLHGHIHDMWVVKDKMLNVGVDVWNYKPVNIDTLIELRESYT